MSLISKPEAAKNGGISAIPESDAEEVSSNLPNSLPCTEAFFQFLQ